MAASGESVVLLLDEPARGKACGARPEGAVGRGGNGGGGGGGGGEPAVPVAAPVAIVGEAGARAGAAPVAAVAFAPDEPQYATGCRYWCAAGLALALSAGASAALVRLASALGATDEPGGAPPKDLSARWATFAALYLLYLVEALCAQCAMEHGVLRFLGNVHAAEERHEELQFFDRMRRTRPRLEMHIECFHHETEHVTVREEDAEGRSRTRTETRHRKVVTFRASEDKAFAQWLDLSSVGPRQVGGSAIGVLVHVHKRVEPADHETTAAFEQQLRAFVLRHAWRDHDYAVAESTTYDEFRSALFMAEPTRKHRCVSAEVYVLLSLLLLSLPFRAWLLYHTVSSDWTLHTRVSVRARDECDLAVPDALAAYDATHLY
jgi:hypothetical protein